MIECPICHVMNDAQAHFCSECGQRFSSSQVAGLASPTPSSGNWQQSTPPTPAPVPVYGQPPSSSAETDFTQPPPLPAANHGYGAAAQGEQTLPLSSISEPQIAAFQSASSPQYQSQPEPILPPSASESTQNYQPSGFNAGANEPSAAPGLPPSSAKPPSDPMTYVGALPAGEPAAFEPEHKEPPKRPRLHSPILGDLDSASEDLPPVDRDLRAPLLRGGDGPPDQPDKGKGRGLRSPLLGSDDSDDPRSQKTPGRVAKPGGGLRSPLLGGGDDKGQNPNRGNFPHRKGASDYDYEPDEQAPPAAPTAKPGKGGLRSPLLGGTPDDDVDDVDPRGRTPQARPDSSSGRPGGRRLHSPVLDGTGEYYYEEYAEESTYSEEDTSILRSPLLAARQKMPTDKPAAEPPAQPQAFARERGFAEPEPVQAEFRDRGFANPSQQSQPQPSNYAPHAGVDNEPLRQAIGSAPNSVSDEVPSPGFRSRPIKISPSTHDDHRVPLSIYDSGLRPTISGELPVRYGLSMVLLAPAVIALGCKVMYFVDLAKIKDITQQTSFLADQFGQVAIIVGIIVFSLSAARRS